MTKKNEFFKEKLVTPLSPCIIIKCTIYRVISLHTKGEITFLLIFLLYLIFNIFSNISIIPKKIIFYPSLKKMFLVKKPKWLEFIYPDYDPRISKAARLQVRHMGNITNTKIIKFDDGSLYLKIGKELFKLRVTQMPAPLCLFEKEGDRFVFKGSVENKCFITENK